MIVEDWDPETDRAKYTTWFHITKENEVYFGESAKNKRDISIAEYNAGLVRINDADIFPETPTDVDLTIAPAHLNDVSAYIKQPGLIHYPSMKGTGQISRAVLDETLVMEQISKTPHPHIVKYHGCKVNRGRITGIVLERHNQTLMQYAAKSDISLAYPDLNRAKFMDALGSAVAYMHSLGLAHNDINPHNIMVRDGMPVLIDFDSCQPFGKHLQSAGTVGWCKEAFWTSEKEHDIYSLNKLQQWLREKYGD